MIPTRQEIMDELEDVLRSLDDPDEGTEVRLQYVPEEGWEVLSGLPDYDLDHQGFWGAGWVEGQYGPDELAEVARDLLDQVEDAMAERRQDA